jgi:hypothetical protein
MAKRRTRKAESFMARTANGQRLRVDVFVTEVDVTTLADTDGDKWTEVSRALRTEDGDHLNSGPGDSFTRARDGVVVTRI